MLIMLTAIVAALLAGGGGGYWWGYTAQTATIASTEAGVSAAFRDGLVAAASWLNLMRANDGNVVQGACAASTVKTGDGRRACAVGLWVDLPASSPPRTEPVHK